MHSMSSSDILLEHVADFMHACACSEDRQSVRMLPRAMLKALSWLARIGQIDILAALTTNQLVKALASPQQPQERKEPPLGVLAAWETQVYNPRRLSAGCS